MNVRKLLKNRKLSTQKEKSGPYESRTGMTLALLAPRSADWANGPLIETYAKYIVFKQWMYANYLKIESYQHKKRNMVRMSLQLMTLALLAPRSADWAKGTLI